MRTPFTWLYSSAGAMIIAHTAGAAHAADAPAADGGPPSGQKLAQEGYSALQAKDAREAARKLLAALDAGGLSPDQQRTVCLSLSDALMSLGHAKEAASLLCMRQQGQGYEVLSRLAYAQDAAEDRRSAAQSYAAAARLGVTPADRTRMSIGQTMALQRIGDRPAALQVARALAGDPNLTQADAINLAYFSLTAKDDRLALRFFAQADQLQALGGSTVLDAAYTARRAGDEDAALRYFRQGLNAAVFGQGDEAMPARDNIRKEVSELSRRGGVVASMFYDSGAQRGARLPGAGSGNLQIGGEAYLRPLGSNRGRPVEVFVRAFETLSSRQGGAVGAKTVQGWVGVRVKPLSGQNIVVEGSRLLKLGSVSRSDWMVRASYSSTRGMDWPARKGPMFNFFVDAAHLVNGGETLVLADARLGRSFSADRSKLIVAPFLGAVVSYDSSLSRATALGAGPGVLARRYFREDRTHAPRSYADFSVQYRVRVAGDRRANGIFVSLSVSC